VRQLPRRIAFTDWRAGEEKLYPAFRSHSIALSPTKAMTHHSSSPGFQAPGSASMKSRTCRSEGGAVIRGHRSFMGKKCDFYIALPYPELRFL